MTAARSPNLPAPRSEAELARAWSDGRLARGRLADGRLLRVVFPGVPGAGAGPDFRDAVLEIAGDLIRGDVEVHVREAGWVGHGHAGDPAYGRVVLHVVGANRSGALVTRSGGRAIPLFVAVPDGRPFRPPCTDAPGELIDDVLGRLGRERLRAKAVRLGSVATVRGPGQALYQAVLEVLGGPQNRAAFIDLANRMPLAALLERVAGIESEAGRRAAVTAELRWSAASLVIRWAGLRPMASPVRRLESAGRLIAGLWGGSPDFPDVLASGTPELPRVPGVGIRTRRELLVNAVVPLLPLVGVPEPDAVRAWEGLRAPGTYGHLRSLERWLQRDGRVPPFAAASRLQGGLLLHREHCARGRCGVCPLSAGRPFGDSTRRRRRAEGSPGSPDSASREPPSSEGTGARVVCRPGHGADGDRA